MAWYFLLLAIVFEVAGTTAMKASDGFRHLLPGVAVVICYLTSVSFLTFAVRSIEISIAYALWSALGMALIGCGLAAIDGRLPAALRARLHRPAARRP